MPTITWPSNTKDTIDDIRTAIGRVLTIYTTTFSGCSVCSRDPMNNSSTDSFCSSCNGSYWIATVTGTEVQAHVRWYPLDDNNIQPGGIVFEGDCIATIAYDAANIALVNGADYYTVDGKTLYLDKYIFRGVPTKNRIRLILKEKET